MRHPLGCEVFGLPAPRDPLRELSFGEVDAGKSVFVSLSYPGPTRGIFFRNPLPRFYTSSERADTQQKSSISWIFGSSCFHQIALGSVASLFTEACRIGSLRGVQHEKLAFETNSETGETFRRLKIVRSVPQAARSLSSVWGGSKTPVLRALFSFIYGMGNPRTLSRLPISKPHHGFQTRKTCIRPLIVPVTK